ncbi:cobalt/nickel transport system permease protein [Proteiniborus sp. DW1]|uniref:energy-coupling factor transporter transmembrane component T family protein n=1 Tax=Proteiniborus sp. DW1 TaxID=1889883 RepID=UPI00092E14FA|nr:energy-coupling factor transporter transmembrane component T [Proteiniborus sp. DW1]SCG83929.1 cobalt/nickel transport system permease protein [Proteiniborus sp. DW1]
MDMFLYIDKDTFLHRLDPRTKLLIMFGTFTIALLFNSLPILVALGVIIILYGQSGKVLSNLKRIRVILFMIALMSIIIWSLTKGGETRILGPITLEGLLYGITVGIKFNVMIVAGMIFLSSTKIEEIALGLVKLKVPYRGAFAFSTAIRLVPMIVGTSYTITQAQKSRGLDLDSGSIFQKVKKYVPLIIPTFISVIRGTNVFSMALESKGFGYDKDRTNLMEISFDGRDYVLMVITLLAVIFSIYAKIAFKL